MSAKTIKQSAVQVLNKEQQETLFLSWNKATDPQYLVTDDQGTVLRLYKSLDRAQNWIKGTTRIIRYNVPAADAVQDHPMPHTHQAGHLIVESLIFLAAVYVVVLVLIRYI